MAEKARLHLSSNHQWGHYNTWQHNLATAATRHLCCRLFRTDCWWSYRHLTQWADVHCDLLGGLELHCPWSSTWLGTAPWHEGPDFVYYYKRASEVLSVNCQLHWLSIQRSSEHERCTKWCPGSYEERGRSLPVYLFRAICEFAQSRDCALGLRNLKVARHQCAISRSHDTGA